ncbi:MAG TPA: hypothetical protein VNI55_06655 [Gaiellaceae bacterium]|nr:hypothetical protein [Gaiellaceae bacterium]
MLRGSSIIAALVVCLGFAAPASADDWLPHPADASWVYEWTDSAYNSVPTKEKVTVKEQKGAAFVLAWTTEGQENPGEALTSVGTVSFQDTLAGLFVTNWSSNPPPSIFPILCGRAAGCGNSLSSAYYNVIWGNRSPAGNDWLVGGTNEDHLYGGYGDDLLRADDDLDSTAGTGDPRANNVPDPRATAPTFADLAFGGAGRDVLIANTSTDRLYDWAGEFNSYLVPFSPFGEQTITRAGSPSNRAFLYAASKADGADPTRGGDASRNGEPYGEIGLVTTGDADFGAQHGGPRDPQPGHQCNGRDRGGLGFSIAPAAAAATIGPSSPTTITSTPSSTLSPVVTPPAEPISLPPGQAKK